MKRKYLFDEEILETDKKEKEEKMKDSKYSFDRFKKSFGETFSKEIKIESYVDEEDESKVLSLFKKYSLKGKLIDKDNNYSIEGKVENIAKFSQEFINNDDLYLELERELKRLKLIDSDKEKEESKKEKDELTFIDEDNQIFSEDEIKNLKWLAKQDIMDKVIELLDKNFSDNEEESETEDDKEEVEKEETKEDKEKNKVKDSFSAFNRNFRSLNDSSDDEIDTISEAWKNRKIKIN